MALSILLVPILAGYWFLIQTRIFQPRISRLTGYHVFFHAGIAGIMLLTVAWILSLGLNSIPSVEAWLAENSLFEYFDLIVLSVVLALCLPPSVKERFRDARSAAVGRVRRCTIRGARQEIPVSLENYRTSPFKMDLFPSLFW